MAAFARNVGNQEAAHGTVSSGIPHLGRDSGTASWLPPPAQLTIGCWTSNGAIVKPNISMTLFAIAKPKEKEGLHLMLIF